MDLKSAKETIGIVGEVVKMAADNPDARQAGGELARAALTVAKTINNALIPLAAVNFAFEKARAYFAGKFQTDLSERASGIPPEHVVEPKASIAGPALQGLAFSHEEPALKEMYLHLLSTAMDGRVSGSAHPAFVEIIRQLDSDEAKLLNSVLKARQGLAIVEIRLNVTDGWQTLFRHLVGFINLKTKEPAVIPRLTAIVDNWIRLGLVTVEYGKYLVGEEQYSWVESRPEYVQFKTKEDKGKLGFERGILAPTALGLQFAKVVGIIPESPPALGEAPS